LHRRTRKNVSVDRYTAANCGGTMGQVDQGLTRDREKASQPMLSKIHMISRLLGYRHISVKWAEVIRQRLTPSSDECSERLLMLLMKKLLFAKMVAQSPSKGMAL